MIFRYRISRCLKAVLFLSSFCLVIVLLSDSLSKSNNGSSPDFTNHNFTRSEMASYQGIQEQQPSAISSPGKGNKSKPKGDDLEDWRKLFISPVGMDQIVESINFLNSHHEVLNVNKFGPVNTSTVVIVVQVHERIEYLKYVISTLEKTRGIENALLVFSHDLSFEPINQLIRSIQFCRVIQIFYPYNIQIFSNTYPGQDPDDCPERISKDEAKSMGCNNWEFPDKYGHYRVAKVTQIKHHWWWKMNYVFDGIMARYNLNTYVILLEEDHYVSPDFLHVFNLMIEHKKEFCDDCRVLCLGTYLKNYKNFQNDIDRLGVHPWFSSKYNMGMAINRETWDLIRNCSNFFCTYDDYNWDWTLLQVSLKCMPSKMRVIFAKAPRVMHIGDCGVHTHKCQPHDAAEKARSLFSQHNNSLFPTSLHVTDNSKRMLKPSKPNGGWGDVRDHKLCEANSFPLKVDPTLPLKAAVLHEVSDAVLSPPQTPLYNASKITKVHGLKNSGVIRTEWEPQVSEEITKLDECDERLYYSPSVKIGGFIWRFTIDYVVTAAESPTPYLAIFVHCSHEDNNIDWTCWATSEFKIISHSPQPADVSRRSDEPDFYTSEESKGWGYNEFIVWKDLEKYTKNGVITIEVRIVVNETYGSFFSSVDLIESNANIRIKQARDNEIEYKLFYVNKEYLMEYSNYFKAVFNRDFEEKKSMCVELEDVDPQDFDQLLQVISPQRKPLTKENIEKILKLADRFEIIDVLYLAGRFLIKGRNNRNEDQMDPFDRLILADKYQLHWSIKDIVADARLDADDLLGNEKYEVLTHKTKVEILEEIAMPHKRTRNIEVIRPFYSFYILDSEINYIKVNARINCKCNEICQCEHMRLKSFYVNKGILLSYSEYFEDKIKFPLMTNQIQSDKTKLPPRRTRKSNSSISDEPGPSAKKSKMDASDKDILIEETIAPFITADEFEELLRVIYPSRKRITDENIKILLKLANILRMPDVIDYCEDFLISQLSKIGVAYSLLELIIFADEYELKELMADYKHVKEVVKKLSNNVTLPDFQ